MEEQNLPIHRGTVGFYDIRDLTLGPWQRMGAEKHPSMAETAKPTSTAMLCVRERCLGGGVSARGV